MSAAYFTDQQWEDIIFEEDNILTNATYENCTFIRCDFCQMDLSAFQFIDCTFIECNLQLIKMTKTLWRDVVFTQSKMIGLRFDEAQNLGLAIKCEHCNLSQSVFYGCKLIQASFEHCNLEHCDFTSADCKKTSFAYAQLLHTQFDQTNLQEADFRHAQNFQINPNNNKLKKAKFSKDGLSGLLTSYQLIIN